MERTVYCDCYYCEHFEDGKCMSETLHVGNMSGCKEFVTSDEKMDAWIAAHEEKPMYYDEYKLKPKVIICRQKLK